MSTVTLTPYRATVLVDDWNRRYLVGQPVIVTRDDHSVLTTRTKSAAYIIGTNTPVILLEAIRGCYALKRVEAIAHCRDLPIEIEVTA